MNEARLARWSRYLIFFIIAVLPLERIPTWELVQPLAATVRLSQVAGLLLILINLPLMWRSRAQLLQKPWRWLMGFWIVCILSAGVAANAGHALTVTFFTIFVGVLAWVIALRFEKEKLHTYLKIIILSALAACVFGFYQFFGDLLGLPASLTGLRDQYTKAVFGFPRIQSTGLEPLYFGNYLLIPGALLIMAGVLGYKRRLAFISLIPIATVVWLTVSRGAIVALAIIMVIGAIIAILRRQFVNGLALVGVALLSVSLAYGLLYLGSTYVAADKSGKTSQAVKNFSKQTTNITSGESSEGRAVARELALSAFVAHPLLGVGPGNFGDYAGAKMPTRFGEGGVIVNNEPLEILAETGALGLLALGMFVLSLALLAWRAIKQNLVDNVAIYGLLLALFAIALQYQTFSTLYITHVWVAIGLLAGVALAPHSNHTKAK